MIRTAILLALAGCLLSACNTMRGVGQDMTSAGQSVTSTAEDVQRKM